MGAPTDPTPGVGATMTPDRARTTSLRPQQKKRKVTRAFAQMQAAKAQQESITGRATGLAANPNAPKPPPPNNIGTVAAMLQAQTAAATPPASPVVPTGGPVNGQVGDVIKPGFNGYASAIPDWAIGTNLISNRGVTLQADAMRALQQASQIVGYWIGGGGFRTMSSQIDLAASKPGLAAAPGHSYHQLGLAIDVNKVTPEIVRALLAVGFKQFDANKEPWHFSYKVVG